MNKFFGKIGYLTNEENPPDSGVWIENIDERDYYGDVIKFSSRWQKAEGLNDDIVINNRISILADPFAYENFQHMKYVVFMGAKWTITSVEVEYPRILLTLGGVYNGE